VLVPNLPTSQQANNHLVRHCPPLAVTPGEPGQRLDYRAAFSLSEPFPRQQLGWKPRLEGLGDQWGIPGWRSNAPAAFPDARGRSHRITAWDHLCFLLMPGRACRSAGILRVERACTRSGPHELVVSAIAIRESTRSPTARATALGVVGSHFRRRAGPRSLLSLNRPDAGLSHSRLARADARRGTRSGSGGHRRAVAAPGPTRMRQTRFDTLSPGC